MWRGIHNSRRVVIFKDVFQATSRQFYLITQSRLYVCQETILIYIILLYIYSTYITLSRHMSLSRSPTNRPFDDLNNLIRSWKVLCIFTVRLCDTRNVLSRSGSATSSG